MMLPTDRYVTVGGVRRDFDTIKAGETFDLYEADGTLVATGCHALEDASSVGIRVDCMIYDHSKGD